MINFSKQMTADSYCIVGLAVLCAIIGGAIYLYTGDVTALKLVVFSVGFLVLMFLYSIATAIIIFPLMKLISKIPTAKRKEPNTPNKLIDPTR